DVLAHDPQLAALDPGHALAVRLDQARLHVGHRLDRTAVLLDHHHLGARAGLQLIHQPLHHFRAGEAATLRAQVVIQDDDVLGPDAALRAQLGDLLDQPDAGVDEEGDAAEDLGEVRI